MPARIQLQPAFVLHTRAYRETSLLVDLLSAEHGRLAAVARGARRRSRRGGCDNALLAPFVPLRVSWCGRAELKTIEAVEGVSPALALAGRALYAAVYLNELTLRTVPVGDADPELFAAYQGAIAGLEDGGLGMSGIETVLRRFEFALLDRLGYGVDWRMPERGHCRYVEESGLQPCDVADDDGMPVLALRAVAAGDYRAPETRRVAKRLARAALRPLLGLKPLRSRELFRA